MAHNGSSSGSRSILQEGSKETEIDSQLFDFAQVEALTDMSRSTSPTSRFTASPPFQFGEGSTSQPSERCFLVLVAPCFTVSHFDARITFPADGMTDLVWHPSTIQDIDEVSGPPRNLEAAADETFGRFLALRLGGMLVLSSAAAAAAATQGERGPFLAAWHVPAAGKRLFGLAGTI
ncbi:hypothetical protein CSAL01_10445 [Colletotrichum salicis]|uniref:Uncharacterized protein n=1 Tax=Colletotrichum salicis TaxID=1209931 RepID=A0A135TX23_9PEZI|nr:hypothetical protein CSAL01_10445 [Colletotrichum salicis]